MDTENWHHKHNYSHKIEDGDTLSFFCDLSYSCVLVWTATLIRQGACGGIGMYFLTHTIHTHNCMCTQHYFSAYLQVHCLYRPTACCCTEIASHSDFTLQLPLNSQLLSVFIRLRCMDDKLSWLRGWSSARCSPQAHVKCLSVTF